MKTRQIRNKVNIMRLCKSTVLLHREYTDTVLQFASTDSDDLLVSGSQAVSLLPVSVPDQSVIPGTISSVYIFAPIIRLAFSTVHLKFQARRCFQGADALRLSPYDLHHKFYKKKGI